MLGNINGSGFGWFQCLFIFKIICVFWYDLLFCEKHINYYCGSLCKC